MVLCRQVRPVRVAPQGSLRAFTSLTLSDRRFSVAVDDLSDLDLDRYPTLPFMRRAWELRASIIAYDAAYVALAETLDCELVTADRRLHQAYGPRCTVRLV